MYRLCPFGNKNHVQCLLNGHDLGCWIQRERFCGFPVVLFVKELPVLFQQLMERMHQYEFTNDKNENRKHLVTDVFLFRLRDFDFRVTPPSFFILFFLVLLQGFHPVV
jgi:hypothetical protein